MSFRVNDEQAEYVYHYPPEMVGFYSKPSDKPSVPMISIEKVNRLMAEHEKGLERVFTDAPDRKSEKDPWILEELSWMCWKAEEVDTHTALIYDPKEIES